AADRPPPAAPPTTPPPRSFTLVAAGDVLLHSPLWEQARADAAAAGLPGHDFRPLLAGVKPLVSGADVAVCHMETPLAPAGGPYAGYPAFSVPPEIAPALADTGFDVCSTASNHTYDRGADGVDRTLAGLDAVGIRHAGSARDPAEANAVTLVPAGEARMALLSYTYGFNGIAAPGGEAWRSNPIDEARIRADAARARAAGADVVVVALHWGLEYQHEPDDQQRTLGPALVRSPDVDLVIGHHAHVVQPIEQVDGEWVVYGMGNFVAHQSTARPRTEEGLLVRFTFTEGEAGWRATAAEYAPLLVERAAPPVRLIAVGAALAAGGDPTRRARLQQAWDTSVAVVGSLGASDHGLRPIGG
ncbi:MAG: CapA family protein, partial [Acidimicrobiales bacterium]